MFDGSSGRRDGDTNAGVNKHYPQCSTLTLSISHTHTHTHTQTHTHHVVDQVYNA